MEVKDTVNPVGNVVVDANLDKFVEAMAAVWDENHESVSWWQFWKRVNFHTVTNFLINCLDDLISYFVEHNIPGADKKATVFEVLGNLYDYIIQGMLPIYLRPFSGMVKNFIINTVVSNAIDWIVEKYKNGEWKPKSQAEVVAQWNMMHAQLFGVSGDHRP